MYRYLYNITPYRITLAADYIKEIEIYINTAYADYKNSKLTEGQIIFYTDSFITWLSNKQSIIIPFSTIIEYCAYNAAAKNALYIKKLAQVFNLKILDNSKISLFSDAANLLQIFNHSTYMWSTRQLDNCYLFMADLIKINIILVQHITGTCNPADGLTKALDREKFCDFQIFLEIILLITFPQHPGNNA